MLAHAGRQARSLAHFLSLTHTPLQTQCQICCSGKEKRKNIYKFFYRVLNKTGLNLVADFSRQWGFNSHIRLFHSYWHGVGKWKRKHESWRTNDSACLFLSLLISPPLLWVFLVPLRVYSNTIMLMLHICQGLTAARRQKSFVWSLGQVLAHWKPYVQSDFTVRPSQRLTFPNSLIMLLDPG